MKIVEKRCYFCNEPAVSREHIPPINLFPKGDDFRENLIKVPSCKKHNNDKSNMDNEMFFFFCASNFAITDDNDFADLKNKSIRAAVRDINLFNSMTDDAKAFKKKFGGGSVISRAPNKEEIIINYRNHKFYQECILRGLNYEKYKKNWTGDLFILPKSLMIFDTEFDKFELYFGMKKFEDTVLAQKNEHAKNKIFQYEFIYNDGDIEIIGVCIYMKYFFYGLFSTKNSLKPIVELFKPGCDMSLFSEISYT